MGKAYNIFITASLIKVESTGIELFDNAELLNFFRVIAKLRDSFLFNYSDETTSLTFFENVGLCRSMISES